MGILLAASI